MWDRAVLIPATEEFEQLPDCLSSLAEHNQNALLVLVLNGRENAPLAVHQNNQQSFDWLCKNQHKKIKEDLWSFQYRGLDIWLLDRFSAGRRLKAKQGVGTARALGADLLVALHRQGLISYPWIWNTDADARFHPSYLNPFSGSKNGVCIHPYIHRPAPKELQIYEISLRYYTLGLHWAGSPYAYPAIGSTISIHIDTYKKTHGFPHKEAGEDFYLLNKAAKIAPISYIDRAPITLIGRESARVPFGTGRGMSQIRNMHYAKPMYNPSTFAQLKIWLNILKNSPEEELVANLQHHTPDFPMLRRLPRLLKQPAKGARILTRRLEWFDAFKTLKWIHHAQEKFPPLAFKEALNKAPFVAVDPSLPLAEVQEQLRKQEESALDKMGLRCVRAAQQP